MQRNLFFLFQFVNLCNIFCCPSLALRSVDTKVLDFFDSAVLKSEKPSTFSNNNQQQQQLEHNGLLLPARPHPRQSQAQ